MSNHQILPNRSLTASLLWIWLLVAGCSPLKKSLRSLDENAVFKDSFTGFVLFDPEDDRILFNHFGTKYFTPASNTKLLTFYVANRILGDSITAFYYRTKGDSTWLWGTGDPSFLNPELPPSGAPIFLQGKHLLLVRDLFNEPLYGPGWAWDDYSGGYQREKSSFPIFGNALHIRWDSVKNQPGFLPSYFTDSVSFGSEQTERNIDINEFKISEEWEKKDTLTLPLKLSEPLTAKLWSDTLAIPVSWIDYIEPAGALPWFSIPADSAYKRMLQVSDNFIAEQLILLCSWDLFGELNSEKTIEILTDSLLNDLPQRPIWVDGSGLSRYNLFTPLSIVYLLKKISSEVSDARIYDLFPAGGQSGTIEDYYHADPPYIYAKTGTLNNNHALSGFLITKKGKRLIFSFMHNHYTNGSGPIKEEMEKLLWQIHLKY